MPPTVIDLLSSDDDKPLRESIISLSKAEFTNRDNEESLFVEDDFDETETARAPKRRKCIPLSPQIEDMKICQDGSDVDSFPEDIIRGAVKKPFHPDLSERTVALLASLGGPTGKKSLGVGKSAKETCGRKTARKNSSRSSDGRVIGAAEQEALSEADDKPKRVRKPKLTDEEKVARAKEKEAEKVAIALEREELKILKQEQKAKEKKEKAEEKQKEVALAEVNKAKLDKKVTATDMIVDLPASINGQVVELQIRAFHAKMQIDTTFYQSPVSNVIRWRRKVKSRYNAENGHHEPLDQMEIEYEKHIMCLLSAQEFVALASAGRDSPNIETHVLNLKINFPDCKPMYLIEGLTTWMRKNSTTLNRAYQAAVLSQMEPNNNQEAESSAAAAPVVASRRSSKKPPANEQYVDPDMIEDALLRLQVLHGCLIHHTTCPVETAEWVSTFTVHISTIPSRLERMNLDSSFCMESGQVKSGEDKQDTYVRMLQEVVRITAPIAYGIAAEYPTLVSLIEGMRKHGPLLLEDIEKCANKNGVRSDRKIGQSISKRLYKVLMGLDATSTDI